MYAVVKSGGKQYRVEAGTVLNVEKIEGEIGSEVTLSDVLLISDGKTITVGRPVVKGASVKAKIVGAPRGKKVIIFKKIKRQGKQWKKGHRQNFARLKVEQIIAG